MKAEHMDRLINLAGEMGITLAASQLESFLVSGLYSKRCTEEQRERFLLELDRISAETEGCEVVNEPEAQKGGAPQGDVRAATQMTAMRCVQANARPLQRAVARSADA